MPRSVCAVFAVEKVTAIKPVEEESIFKNVEASEAQDAANMQEIYDDMDFRLEGEHDNLSPVEVVEYQLI